MRSRTSKRFRTELDHLPRSVRRQARRAYERFAVNPHHSSLQFRQVHAVLPVYSARVGLQYRAVGLVDGDEVVWFWIGTHADYDALLAQLR
jgi:hypothetical protein